jgi:hypothetical protein
LPNSCDKSKCWRTRAIPAKGCSYQNDRDMLLVGINENALRVCLTCGFEAHTLEDIKLFKKHCKNDKRIKYYPYGIEAICLKCYRKKNREQKRIAHSKNPIPFRERSAKHFRENPEKHKAVCFSHTHLKVGICCEKCGSIENLNKHHPDYSRPDYVITLCASCHHKIHMVVPEGIHYSPNYQQSPFHTYNYPSSLHSN